MVNFKEIYRFSRLQMGSNFFQGVQLFPGGVQLLIPYSNPFNLRFSRGGPDPLPPLWIRTWCSPHSFMVKATIHDFIWAWQTLIDRRMYHPFIVIYLTAGFISDKNDCRGLNCHFNLLTDIPLRVKIPSLMLY